jgi:hypothetical protein
MHTIHNDPAYIQSTADLPWLTLLEYFLQSKWENMELG